MAETVLKKAFVSIGGTDVSAFVQSVALNYSADELDNTTMGGDFKKRLGGLKDWSVTVTFVQDYATLDPILFNGVGSLLAFEGRPTNSAVGAGNPKFTGSTLLKEYNPIEGKVGDLAVVSVSMPGSGALTRATA
ncbi:hypothetical protein ACN2C7_10945 [Caulobacter sp. ErkDOM-E]|uniref:hypothetical protein n=1 Tax=Caulobacter sp. ErkDOM-E TaxID=3402778 RepID=UPI003AF580AD